MADFDLKKYLSERKKLVDDALEKLFPSPSGLEKKVMEAARYSLFAGGKRLRPLLCLAAAEVVGGRVSQVMPAACAFEMIHTYSLIHDDLPAMDNDDFRRGKPTCHKVFGEAMAILAGDALLTEAFDVTAGMLDSGHFSPERIVRVVGIMAGASGHKGMVGGQTIDLECENREVDLATVEYMHVRKTGALLTASLEAGAVLGGGSPEEVKALRHYGFHFGLAFQITDDILDVEGDAQVMGKTPGSDQAKHKSTYPTLLGLPQSKEAAGRNVEAAVDALGSFDQSAEPLRAMAKYLLHRRA